MRSDTTRFIVPLTKLNRNLILTKGFIESYLYWDEFPEENNCVFLLYKSMKDVNIPTYEIRKIIMTNRGVILIIPLATGLSKEISKIIKGQYSKLNFEVKNLILDFWSATKNSMLNGVLFKKGKASKVTNIVTGLLNEEYWPSLNVEKSTLKTKV
jgi:hypothetical protein